MIGTIFGLLSRLVVGLVVFTVQALRWSARSLSNAVTGIAIFVLALAAADIALHLLIDAATGAWSAFRARPGLQLLLAGVVAIVIVYKIVRRCGLMGR